MEYSLFYMTASSRFAACVNILGETSSLFRWQGEVRSETEIALIAKTKKTLVQKIVTKVKAIHSYECPCIVALPLSDGSADFLSWIGAETL